MLDNAIDYGDGSKKRLLVTVYIKDGSYCRGRIELRQTHSVLRTRLERQQICPTRNDRAGDDVSLGEGEEVLISGKCCPQFRLPGV